MSANPAEFSRLQAAAVLATERLKQQDLRCRLHTSVRNLGAIAAAAGTGWVVAEEQLSALPVSAALAGTALAVLALHTERVQHEELEAVSIEEKTAQTELESHSTSS